MKVFTDLLSNASEEIQRSFIVTLFFLEPNPTNTISNTNVSDNFVGSNHSIFSPKPSWFGQEGIRPTVSSSFSSGKEDDSNIIKTSSDDTTSESKPVLPPNEGEDIMSAQNKANAIAFYKMAYEGNPREAVKEYVGAEYIQHNPLVANGPEGFIEYFERMQKEYPEKSIEFVRAVAEGNLVALHTHQIWPGGDEYVTMDFFRFDEQGKIVEHWDSMQEIPKGKSKNGNTMY